MNTIDWTDINSFAVRHLQKWAAYVSIGEPSDETLSFVRDQVAKLYGRDQVTKLYGPGDAQRFNDISTLIFTGGMVLFDTEQEMDEFFDIFNQELTYKRGYYVCTYDPNGNCLTENT